MGPLNNSTIVELAELVLKNNIFNFNEKKLKQKRGTAIGTKFALAYRVLFMAQLEEKSIEKVYIKRDLRWRYINDIFFIWEPGEDKLRNFVEPLNEIHTAISLLQGGHRN